MISLRRFFCLAFVWMMLFSLRTAAQPRIKGKRLDTTQTVLGDDSTVKKLTAFKDSLAKVGPESEGPRKEEESDPTVLIVLIVGSVLVIIWAGRRAWLRQRKS